MKFITWMDEVRWARSPDTPISSDLLRTHTHPTQNLSLSDSKQRASNDCQKQATTTKQSEGELYKHHEEAGSPGRWRRLRHPATAGCLCTATCSSTSFSPAAKSFSTRWSHHVSRFAQFCFFGLLLYWILSIPCCFTSIAFAPRCSYTPSSSPTRSS